MSDNGMDLLVYIALTIGAGALSLLKSSREKKARATRPEIFEPDNQYETEPETRVTMEQPTPEHSRDLFTQITEPNDELAQKIKQVKQAGIAKFGKNDEERYAMLEKLRQESRSGRKKRYSTLLTEEQDETSNEQLSEKQSSDFEFDIRKAIISNEILSRKY